MILMNFLLRRIQNFLIVKIWLRNKCKRIHLKNFTNNHSKYNKKENKGLKLYKIKKKSKYLNYHLYHRLINVVEKYVG
jgi:hypothetical protein